MVSAVSVSALNGGIGSSIGIGLKCGIGTSLVGMGLPRAAWVKLNRLRTGVGRFHSSMHKWGLAPSPNCECGASEQTADHVLTMCPIHRAPHGARGLTVLDDETRCWLNNITASI